MIARAMPEGVLDPGGRLDGYVYFEKPQQQRGTPVELRVDLRGARSGDPSTTLVLRFLIEHSPS
jgi:hypothetical protein